MITQLSDTTGEKIFLTCGYLSEFDTGGCQLKEGLKEDIAIYDYNPAGKMGS